MPDKQEMRDAWAEAFRVQALADFEVWTLLSISDAAPYARLHFLQMALEKACKAYLLPKTDYENLELSHCILRKQLPRVLENQLSKSTAWDHRRIAAYLRKIAPLMLELQVLSPACDEAGTRTDNTEYPWMDRSAQIQIPCRHQFSSCNDQDRHMVELLKLMRKAVETSRPKA